MIEFSGEFSEASKKYLLKQQLFIGVFASLVVSAVFGTAIIIVAWVSDLWIITWFMLLVVLASVLLTISPYLQKKKTLQMIVPKKISIDEDYIYCDLENASVCKILGSVKKVIDFGEWYLIKLHLKIGGFLCQKDLIKQGTIAEFEKLFEGKIVQKL